MRLTIYTIGAKNSAASAILEVMTTCGLCLSKHWTIGEAPKYVLMPFTSQI